MTRPLHIFAALALVALLGFSLLSCRASVCAGRGVRVCLGHGRR